MNWLELLLLMMLFLTSVDRENQYRPFSCQLNRLEVAFDFLSDIVGKGSTLKEAYIVDEGKRTDLPIAVFDGEPFLLAMQELEKDWQSLLNDPIISASTSAQQLTPLFQKRVQQFETRIATYQQMIGRLEQLLHRTEENFSLGPMRAKVITQYESMIYKNQIWLIKAQVSHKVVLARLEQLNALGNA
jgi:hypothetical protein